MSSLIDLNQKLRLDFIALRDEIIRRHSGARRPSFASYPLADLAARITERLREATGLAEIHPQLNLTDRQQFGGDVAITVNELLRGEGGTKDYVKTYVPVLVQALKDPSLESIIERVESKGIYINVLLRDQFLIQSAEMILDIGAEFGLSDFESDRVFVIDYSSPNIAKQLHAGHIRSTIIGQVLCNLHEACGGIVYPVNHINDFGGFGFILEGYRRWRDHLSGLSPNEKLLRVYAIRRTLERAAAVESLDGLTEEDRALISDLNITSIEELRNEYADFVRVSDEVFEHLEEGRPEVVARWREMVQWSLADFQSFYDALGVHIDFVIGESFYAEAGNQVVDDALRSGRAVLFTAELAAQAKQGIAELLAAGKVSPAEHQAMVGLIEKDIGAVVIPLPDNERLVVRRSDGRSVYSTRDLGAIRVRRELFDPTDILYVVGQEQRVHFSRVFKAAEVLGLVSDGDVNLKHIYFGFYVDARSKKKLSSRETTSNVYLLLQGATEYFSRKYEGDESWSREDVDQAARQLSVGSLIFNDLRKDMKGSVDIGTEDLDSTIAGFEKSGGAYVVYAACRARSILRKYSGRLPRAADLSGFELSDQECWLILQLLQIPDKVADAADRGDPSILVRHLLDVSTTYNSYYAKSPVLRNDDVREHRLVITAAVRQALENALLICQIDCPPKI